MQANERKLGCSCLFPLSFRKRQTRQILLTTARLAAYTMITHWEELQNQANDKDTNTIHCLKLYSQVPVQLEMMRISRNVSQTGHDLGNKNPVAPQPVITPSMWRRFIIQPAFTRGPKTKYHLWHACQAKQLCVSVFLRIFNVLQTPSL